MYFFKLLKKIKPLCISMVLLTMVVSGCGGGGGGGGTSDPAPAPISSNKGSLKVINNTGQTINHLYVSPSSSSSWGLDQLSSNISNGGSHTVTNITAGSYDIKVTLADNSTKTTYGVNIVGGVTKTITFTAPAPSTGSIKITNNTGKSIYDVYISLSSSGTWGVNQLGSGTISNGSTHTFINVPTGTYDVKVVLSDGTVKYHYGFTVYAGVTTTVTFSAPAPTNGSVKILNHSGQTIYYAYISPTSSSTWGNDQLGSSVIANNASFTITNIPAGQYDFKAVLADNTARYLYNFTVSAGSTFTITVNP